MHLDTYIFTKAKFQKNLLISAYKKTIFTVVLKIL